MRFSLIPKFYYSPALRLLPPYYRSIRFNDMSTDLPEPKPPITAAEKVKKFQEVFHSTNSWDKCWDEGLTPWDLGSPTPVLVHLHNTGSLPKGRALVPGCGSGYDVVAIACAECHVVGLDVSDNAIKKAMELMSGSPKAEHCTFLKTDFFTWCPDQPFDLIFDYTFFCAIEPELRSLWAKKISDLLKPDGELITLMYPIDDHEGGPPFKVSVADYEEALHPVGFEAMDISENELAIAPRKGREKLGRWRRSLRHASL
ncbi:thiocyanate methyltransferase 1-like isoform X2 [Salvia miltiorrhiza]|uniref:thiocyanate methyltransferase 1-like isoform X2 n=1 Tax=Salvia miltiorrhiza TaxID=226208 RepID=UPI0025ACD1D0|nr:thiocyanate methyltransferase 1-like isoform X2 [Salvia miltiorrhiza]